MKKYISPVAKEIKISAESLIAGSPGIDNTETTPDAGESNRRTSIWDDQLY